MSSSLYLLGIKGCDCYTNLPVLNFAAIQNVSTLLNIYFFHYFYFCRSCLPFPCLGSFEINHSSSSHVLLYTGNEVSTTCSGLSGESHSIFNICSNNHFYPFLSVWHTFDENCLNVFTGLHYKNSIQKKEECQKRVFSMYMRKNMLHCTLLSKL